METEAVSEASVDLKLLTRLLAREQNILNLQCYVVAYIPRIQGDSVGKANILGGDSIGHCEERSSFGHVSDCECISLSPFSAL
jgi:hypothetical protein